MKNPRANRKDEGGRVVYERCLCREAIDQVRDLLGISPAVREHLKSSRIEFLKAIRTVIDERIEHLSTPAQRGTRVVVE
ncbi:MAG TPA: hypothetical protein VMT53_20105 [Terriglobales bacterium]|nr:hypothetical protein [Terriglobales bacterium]